MFLFNLTKKGGSIDFTQSKVAMCLLIFFQSDVFQSRILTKILQKVILPACLTMFGFVSLEITPSRHGVVLDL